MTFSPRTPQQISYIPRMSTPTPWLTFTHVQLLRGAGLFTWGCVGIPLLLRLSSPGAGIGAPLLLAYGAFGICYAYLTWKFDERERALNAVLLLLMTASALMITYLTKSGLGAILLILSAGLLPWLFPLRLGLIIMAAQNLAMLPVLSSSEKLSLLEALLQVGLYFGSCSFMFMTAWIGTRQYQARQALDQANLELRATQAMLSETERTAERLRISRDLHDLVGHHLTALSLNLEVASHLSEGKTLKHVQQAQAISKLLLADVREVVSTLRESDPIQVDAALQAMAAAIPSPKVRLNLPAPLRIQDPERAQVLLRLAQEILTNAIKHAQAKNLWLSFSQSDEGVEISAYDDGRGADMVAAGNGISGMKERLAAVGGTLMVHSEPGRGFNLAGFLPVKPPALTEVSQFLRSES
jgi:signal transduction histidine kinase